MPAVPVQPPATPAAPPSPPGAPDPLAPAVADLRRRLADEEAAAARHTEAAGRLRAALVALGSAAPPAPAPMPPVAPWVQPWPPVAPWPPMVWPPQPLRVGDGWPWPYGPYDGIWIGDPPPSQRPTITVTGAAATGALVTMLPGWASHAACAGNPFPVGTTFWAGDTLAGFPPIGGDGRALPAGAPVTGLLFASAPSPGCGSAPPS